MNTSTNIKDLRSSLSPIISARVPDLLFIAANALAYIWIDVLPKASKDLFIRLLSFLVESYSEIKEYRDRSGAELLYTTVLEKLEKLSDNIWKDYVEICHSQEASQLLRLFSRFVLPLFILGKDL